MEKPHIDDSLGFPPMEMDEVSVSKAVAMIACTAMSFLYVAILYSPTLILRLPHPTSLNSFMIRRFICAGVSSIVSIFVCALLLLPWNAVVYPLSLTSLLYTGSFASKFLSLMDTRRRDNVRCDSMWCMKNAARSFLERMTSVASNVLAWRNYVVAPLTEELVFRACMIPLLLCGGFKPYNIIIFSPIFFSLAHLNHFLELYCQQNYNFVKAALIVGGTVGSSYASMGLNNAKGPDGVIMSHCGLQLCYTVIFGSFAAFLFIRTGHIVAPLVAHIFCNIMGLPVLSSRRKGLTGAATLVGFAGFLWLLFPATSPNLYNDRTDDCRCWHGYCGWS